MATNKQPTYTPETSWPVTEVLALAQAEAETKTTEGGDHVPL